MAAEVLLNTELSLCLYKAISEKNYKRVIFLYADIARKAVLCNSRWNNNTNHTHAAATSSSSSMMQISSTSSSSSVARVSSSSSMRPSQSFLNSEEKVDEFYGSNVTSSNIGMRGGSRGGKAAAPYNLMVMEELDSIMEMASGRSGDGKMMGMMEDGQDDYEQYIFNEYDKFKGDQMMSSNDTNSNNIWQQAQQSRRSRKNNHHHSFSTGGSGGGGGMFGSVALPYQEEELSMRSAAKVLSNTRAPPSFVFYSNNHSNSTTESVEEEELEEDGDRTTNSTPLFDGSAAGSGGTLLHLACIVDAPLALALLLALGGDPTGRHSAFRRLPVHETCCSDSEHCLALLLHLAATSSNKHDHEEDTSMSMDKLHHDYHSFCTGVVGTTADNCNVGRSFAQTLRLALEMVNESSNKSDWNELEAAKTLLSQVALPHSTRSALHSFSPTSSTPDGHGNTPLHWASFKNAKSCVNLLLQHGADPNAKAHPSGWTPLHDASYSNASASLFLLLEAGAYVDARASSGATPLCFAAQEDAPDSALLLLNAGASTTIRCCGSAAILNVVHGALQPPPPHQPSSRFSGYTPLHYCAHYNASGAAKLILQHNADNIMHIPDLSNKLPVHVAVIRGSDAVLKQLFSFGAVLPPSLSQHLPKRPVQSTKPWNCLTKERISKCIYLVHEASLEWSMTRHYLFSPVDKSSIRTILTIAKRWEQCNYGIYLKEVWLEVLSFIGRGWFESTTTSSEVQCNQQRFQPFITYNRGIGSNTTATTVRPIMHNINFNDDDTMVDYNLDDEDEQEESDDDTYPYLVD